MDGASHTVILKVLAFPAARWLRKSTIVLNSLPVLPIPLSMITFTKDFIQSTEIFLEILASLLACPRKNGFIAKPLVYTSASSFFFFFLTVLRHSPCNTSVYLGNFLPLLEKINHAAFQNKVLLLEQNNKKKSEGSGRYLFPQTPSKKAADKKWN